MADSFIFFGDYSRAIQSDNLMQIIGNDYSVLDSVQRLAMDEVKSFIKSKYNLKALAPISEHNPSNTYLAGKTVYLNAKQYSSRSTYAIGDQVVNNGNVYSCNTTISVVESFNSAKWDLIGKQYDIYYAVNPAEEFDYLNVYIKGDTVFYKDKVYTCQTGTRVLDHQAQINIGVQSESNINNIFPDDPQQGVIYWGHGVSYSVTANTLITDETYWTLGDNRDQKLLQACIDIVLYHLHARIAPRNIPDIRVTRYMGEPSDRMTKGQRILYPITSALGWLQAIEIGTDITPSMPENQPKTGNRILRGGNFKNTNSY